jgi:hypothetical protein
MVCVSLVEHAIQRSVLVSVPASASIRITTSWNVVISSGVVRSALAFELWRFENFLPIFWWPTSIGINSMDLLVCSVKI